MEENEEEIESMKELSKSEYIFYNDNIINNINPNKNQIKLSPEKIRYDLILEKGEDEQIIITIIENNQQSITKYQSILNIENFINLSIYFKLIYKLFPIYCIDKFYIYIKSKLDKNIIKNNNFNSTINIINLKNSKINIFHTKTSFDNIFFTFDIVYMNLKIEKINIKLKKIESTFNEGITKIFQMLFKNKCKYIQKLNFLEQKLYQNQSKAKEYNTLINKCNEYFGQNMRLKMAFMDIGIDTDILDSPEQYYFIINTLSQKLNKKNISLEQIFKASSNGDDIYSFHQWCDNIPNTLIIISTDENKRKFGGFTSKVWDQSNKNKIDEKAFLFSLDNLEIYPILDKYKDKAINCRKNFYAPYFGEDLLIFDGFFSNQFNKTEEKYYNYGESALNEEYKLSGQKYFTVSEMEVYKVNFLE